MVRCTTSERNAAIPIRAIHRSQVRRGHDHVFNLVAVPARRRNPGKVEGTEQVSTTLPENLSASLVVSEEIRRELMASPATAEAEAFTIASHLLAQEASDLAGECRAQVKRVYVLFAEFVEPAKLIIERANSIFKPRLADLEGGSQIYMAKIERKRTR